MRGCVKFVGVSSTQPFSHNCRWFIVIVLFTARGAAAGFFQTVYVYTPEVYPTKLRALAMGE